jgi:hypothetical protein
MENKNPIKDKLFHVSLSYGDESVSYIEMKSEHLADIMMAARGWLITSLAADKVTIYNEEGFVVESYIKN